MKFLHRALGYQSLSTVRRAISAEYLDSFPDLTERNISKLNTPDTTIFGHLDTKRKNLKSTKPNRPEDDWMHVLKSHISNKMQEFYHKIVDLKDTVYTD